MKAKFLKLANKPMKISAREGVGSHDEGFWEIELITKDGRFTTGPKLNTVTKVGRQAKLARSSNDMLMEFGGSPYGRMRSVDMLGTIKASYNDVLKMYTKQDEGLNVYLVNLPEEVTLSADSKFLPIFDSNFDIDATKLIGFANSRDVTADTREGIQDFTKAGYMIDEMCIANRWKFAEGVATGTFNHIAVVGGMHGNLKCNGIYAKKCITRINQFEDVAEFGNKFIIPGATGITGPNEILLDYNRNGISRWRYNLATGETTQVESTDIAYNMTMYESWAQVYVDGFLYVLDKSGYVRKINTTTGATVASKDVASYMHCGASMYHDGTNLIVMSSYNSDEGDYDYRAQVYTVNPSTLAVSSTVNKTDWTGWGGIPTGWSRNRMTVKKAGAYYYVNHNYETIKCTDITKIKGPVVSSYLSHPLVHYVEVGSDIWMIEVGVNDINYSTMENNKVDSLDYLRNSNLYNRVMDNGTERLYQYHNQGVWISKEWAGNIISFVKLASPITKGATDIMYLSYGYKFN